MQMDAEVLTMGVLRCEVLATAFRAGFSLQKYDRNIDAFLLKKGDVSRYVLGDYSFTSIEENLCRFAYAEVTFGAENIIIACSDIERAKLYRAANPTIRFYKLFEIRKAKSYRRRPDR